MKKTVWRKAAGIAALCIILVLLTNMVYGLSMHSAYIHCESPVLTTELDNQYYGTSSLSAYGQHDATVSFLLMGGNYDMGTLHVKDSAEIQLVAGIDLGAIRVLLVSEDEEICFDGFVSEDKQELSLKEGKYRIYLVGSWFKGKVEISFTNGTFEAT